MHASLQWATQGLIGFCNAKCNAVILVICSRSSFHRIAQTQLARTQHQKRTLGVLAASAITEYSHPSPG